MRDSRLDRQEDRDQMDRNSSRHRSERAEASDQGRVRSKPREGIRPLGLEVRTSIQTRKLTNPNPYGDIKVDSLTHPETAVIRPDIGIFGQV